MRFPALLCTLLLAGCASLGPSAAPPHVYVLLGEQGAATVRAITTAAHCPDIEVDGRSVPMSMRAAASNASWLNSFPFSPSASPLSLRMIRWFWFAIPYSFFTALSGNIIHDFAGRCKAMERIRARKCGVFARVFAKPPQA